MRKITALTALLALSLSFSTTHAGDRSSLEPQSRSGPSFIPAITPPLSGSPGNDKYLQSNVSGVVSWATKPGASQISYSPSTPGNWPLIPSQVAPTITGSIVGSDLLLAANGLFGKDITWQLRIERA